MRPAFAPAAQWSRAFASGFLAKDEVENRILAVVKNFQNVDAAKVTATSHFTNDLGLDSLDTVEVTSPSLPQSHGCFWSARQPWGRATRLSLEGALVLGSRGEMGSINQQAQWHFVAGRTLPLDAASSLLVLLLARGPRGPAKRFPPSPNPLPPHFSDYGEGNNTPLSLHTGHQPHKCSSRR